jgi:TonB family protein
MAFWTLEKTLMVTLKSTTATFFLALVLLQASTAGAATTAFAQTTAASVANAEERQHGIELYRQGKFPEASNLLLKAVKKNKADAEAWYYLGLTLLHQPKELKNASKAFETALNLRPNYGPAYAGLAYSFLLRQKTNDALRKAQQAISIDPNIPDAHYVSGVALLRMGNREDALREANTAIDLDPHAASPYLLKSQALLTSESIPPLPPQDDGRAIRIVQYRDAADALEKYLQIAKNLEENSIWGDQLEALRFYVSMQSRKDTEREVIDPSEATVRARVISKPEPQYTEEARKNQVVGTVILRAVFTADGSVKHILVIKALPNGLTEKSVQAAQRIKFVPAMLNGRPVSMFVQLEYSFNLY